jgi:hypothetical protein
MVFFLQKNDKILKILDPFQKDSSQKLVSTWDQHKRN